MDAVLHGIFSPWVLGGFLSKFCFVFVLLLLDALAQCVFVLLVACFINVLFSLFVVILAGKVN